MVYPIQHNSEIGHSQSRAPQSQYQQYTQQQQQFGSHSDPIQASAFSLAETGWTSAHRATASDPAPQYPSAQETSFDTMTSTMSAASSYNSLHQQPAQQPILGYSAQGPSTSTYHAGYAPSNAMPMSQGYGGPASGPRTPGLAFAQSPTSGVYGHRRMETAPSSSNIAQQQFASTSFGQPMASQPPMTMSRAPRGFGPLQVHQFFPTMGETGVPVTFLITVKPAWAREVGLQLSEGRFGGYIFGGQTNRIGSQLIISFGQVDVETRTERSIAGVDGSMGGFSHLEDQHTTRDVDLTVIAHAPPYPGPALPNPNQGGKVPIRIKLIGGGLNPASLGQLATGVEIGEFCYWQVSPRSNLKRSGEQLPDDVTLRRPASFPNFGSAMQLDASTSTTAAAAHSAGPARPGQPRALTNRRSALSIPRQALQHRSTLSVSAADDRTTTDYGVHSSSTIGSGVSPPSARGQSLGMRDDSSFNTPLLVRSSQLSLTDSSSMPTSSTSSAFAGASYDTRTTASSSPSPPEHRSGLSQRANLQIHGNLQDMALGWSHDEWRSGRRLVQFWRKQEGTTIHAVCKAILPEQYIPNSIVVSCIFWEVTNECYITSVDIIYLLEALVASRFNVEEKNRIRRNLEGLKPKTISKVGKSSDERINRVHEEFFKQVMTFPDPRPRHIEKDIKIFPWRVLAPALNKIISKYSAAPAPLPSSSNEAMQKQLQRNSSSASANTQSQSLDSSDDSGNASGSSPENRRKGLPLGTGLSIDVAASNSAYVPGTGGRAFVKTEGSSNTTGQPSLNTPSGGGLLAPISSSPRRSAFTGGSNTPFNFSDFVVSPVAFGLTPLQQSQQQGASASQYNSSSQQYYATEQQQQTSSGPNVSTGGLGMDLGHPRRD